MAQANATLTDARQNLEPHYALSEEQKYNLHVIARALSGLARLTAPDEADLSRQEANPVREDLSAIFELIGTNLDQAIKTMGWVPASALAPPENVVTLTPQKTRH